MILHIDVLFVIICRRGVVSASNRDSLQVLKKIASALLPPIIFQAAQRTRQMLADPDKLFMGDDQMFKSALKNARAYGEYGCGQSTRYVARNTSLNIVSVDSSEDWVTRIRAEIENKTGNGRTLAVEFIDLGPIGNWGMPTTTVLAMNLIAIQATCGVKTSSQTLYS